MKEGQAAIIDLFQDHFGFLPSRVDALTPSGSARLYYRLTHPSGKTFIGTLSTQREENEAFIGFSSQLRRAGVNVPEVYCANLSNGVYIQEDLGDHSLYNLLDDTSEKGLENRLQGFKQAIDLLLKVQVNGSNYIDYNLCFPVHELDRNNVLWDLNYFKYYFIKLYDLPIDENALEEEFNQFAKELVEAGPSGFLVRDFQSRNIMIKGGKSYLIDFQSGRKGPIYYDLVSLLWQAKAQLSDEEKSQLQHYYFSKASGPMGLNLADFQADYMRFVLFRTLQVLGAYGLRGVVQRKPHFLSSIPLAIKNLKSLASKKEFFPKLDNLWNAFSHYLNHVYDENEF